MSQVHSVGGISKADGQPAKMPRPAEAERGQPRGDHDLVCDHCCSLFPHYVTDVAGPTE